MAHAVASVAKVVEKTKNCRRQPGHAQRVGGDQGQDADLGILPRDAPPILREDCHPILDDGHERGFYGDVGGHRERVIAAARILLYGVDQKVSGNLVSPWHDPRQAHQ